MKRFYTPILDEKFFASIGRAVLLLCFFVVPLIWLILSSDLIRFPPVEFEGGIQSSVNNDPVDHQFGDLQAQQGMWGAAVALVLLTLGQIVVGLLTLGLVYNTFRVQRGELDATTYASRVQLRPYISLESFDIKVIGNNNSLALITIRLKNTGHTIARVSNKLCLFKGDLILRDQLGEMSSSHLGYHVLAAEVGESAYTPVNPQQEFMFQHKFSLEPMQEIHNVAYGSAAESSISKDGIESYMIRGEFYFRDSFSVKERKVIIDFSRTVVLSTGRVSENVYATNDRLLEKEPPDTEVWNST